MGCKRGRGRQVGCKGGGEWGVREGGGVGGEGGVREGEAQQRTLLASPH